MLCRRCKRPLDNPRSIRRRYGPRCWAKEQSEFAAAAQGDLFDGFKNWDAYVARHGRWHGTRTPYALVDLGEGGGDGTLIRVTKRLRPTATVTKHLSG